MRVLVVHNHYRTDLPSGENKIVDAEIELLRGAGLTVESFFRRSDDISELSPLQRMALGASPTYNVTSVRDFRRVMRRFRPDIVHLHNPFPLISPAVIRAAKSFGSIVVQTVHNYRHSCPAGTHLRDSQICELCAGRSVPWPAVTHGCYRNSRGQSLAMAASALVHRPTWALVDHYFAVSELVAEKLCANAGVPSWKVSVKPNSVPDPGAPPRVGNTLLFAGRLERAKGIELLLDVLSDARTDVDVPFVVAGDGPLRSEVAAAARVGVVTYVGAASPLEMPVLIRQSRAVVVPSLWFEGLPTVALEAFALGRGVVTTNLGALSGPNYSNAVWCAEPSTSELRHVLTCATDPTQASEKGAAARALYLDRFTPTTVITHLVQKYGNLLRLRGRLEPEHTDFGPSSDFGRSPNEYPDGARAT